MSIIKSLHALEILDSRGRPTVRAHCELESGTVGIADVPSGASTGRAEALELRDGDEKRYRGLGCRRAVENVKTEIGSALRGLRFESQRSLDDELLSLDGTNNKSRLGANALLAVSLAFARAAAVEQGTPLYSYFAAQADLPVATLPRPTINLFSGGKHAGGQVTIQDVLAVPVAARTIDEALATTYEVYQSAAELAAEKYGTRALTADEGGLAPPFPDAESMLADAVASIERAGFVPGDEVVLAVDVASSHFYHEGFYHLKDTPLGSEEMIGALIQWIERYPIISIEDGLAEEDWQNWPLLRQRIAGRVLTLGDDFLCTNPERIMRARESGAADALLLKVNQIGTLSEAIVANRLALEADWRVVVSARSGETEDNWLADLAVGWGGDYIKIGSITQSERLAKYNRLLEIEQETELSFKSY